MPVPVITPRSARPLLRDAAANQIRSAILDGTLSAGERIHDDELSTWLGVSRTPVREALAALTCEGLVESVAGRYNRVALPRADDALSALQTLGVMTAGLVRSTVPTMGDDDLGAFHERVTAELRRLEAGGSVRLTLAEGSGHQAWIDLCPNPVLAATAQRVMDGLAYRLRLDAIAQLVPAEHLLVHLPEFRDAVLSGDAVTAELVVGVLHMLPEGQVPAPEVPRVLPAPAVVGPAGPAEVDGPLSLQDGAVRSSPAGVRTHGGRGVD